MPGGLPKNFIRSNNKFFDNFTGYPDFGLQKEECYLTEVSLSIYKSMHQLNQDQ